MGANAMPSTVLVTGGCGYLGSQVIRDLSHHLPSLTTLRILDNMRPGQMRALMDLPAHVAYEFIEGDLLDPSTLRWALHEVDLVIHLAAVVRTPLSFENPAWLEQVNHWGTAQLVEACLGAGTTRLIFAGTAAVYGPGGPFDERAVCRPQGPYAQSKLAAERVMLAAQARGLQPTLLRLGTLFGLAPVTRFDAVANRFAYLAGICRPLTVYGDGQQRRPLVHVVDAASAIGHFAAHPDAVDPDPIFNVVGSTPSVLEIVEAVQHTAPTTAVHFTEQDIRTHLSFAAANDKLVAQGWAPAFTLADGMHEIIQRFTGLRRFMPHRGDLDEL
jgi:UDP-glucose 4-epimerase